MKIGSSDISKIFIGATEVQKIIGGTTELFSSIPIYSVTDNQTSANEGTTITFTTTTENVDDGTTLYYTISGVSSSDIGVSLNGSFTINNNTGSVSVPITNDSLTEGLETLTFNVRTGSTSGTVVATNTTVINDTSLTPPSYMSFVVIAGGGGGGSQGIYATGGGGAGGYISSVPGERSGGNTNPVNRHTISSGDSFSVIVGGGGAVNTQGSTSSLIGSGLNISSVGGGRGRNDGGSGGGNNRRFGYTYGPGLGTANQGTDGGNYTSEELSGGGGGGAFQPGQGKNGGDGITSSITGTNVTRAGGGGGGGHGSYGGYNNYGGIGGAGGGGTGDTRSGGTSGSAGTANTGGGGGGCYDDPNRSKPGGSGVVIVRYPSYENLSISSGLQYNSYSTGGDTVIEFTGGSDTITFT